MHSLPCYLWFFRNVSRFFPQLLSSRESPHREREQLFNILLKFIHRYRVAQCMSRSSRSLSGESDRGRPGQSVQAEAVCDILAR